MTYTHRVLIVDLIGLAPGADGQPSPHEVEAHIIEKGGRFHVGSARTVSRPEPGLVHFFYCPDLSSEDEINEEAAVGYDAVIAAATIVPAEARFPRGGVRIGAGTGNMRSRCWGGSSGTGGAAPLMNTPGINSRATAQMVFKAILRVRPDLPIDRLHDKVTMGAFDTGRDLRNYPTRALETHRLAVIGFGNIGREVARLGQAFGMDVVVHARPHHRDWIEARGFSYAASATDAAREADILSVHIGLGPPDQNSDRYANSGVIDRGVLSALNNGALVINFDRGEVIDLAALCAALASDKVGHAAIDADIFVSAGQAPTGPLAPYLLLEREFEGRVLLLPHAVADTDHPSRVAGARYAVDQIMDALRHRCVSNLVGTCPDSYKDLGSRGNWEILGPSHSHMKRLMGANELVDLQSQLRDIQQFVVDLSSGSKELDIYHGVLAATKVHTALQSLGLLGPVRQLD